MLGRTIAIGDIHGCALALFALLEAIEPRAEDTLITLGDYVDRGPDTPRVIDQLLQLRERCNLVPLIGNHEAAMLAALDGETELSFWLSIGGAATVAAYGRVESIPAEHLEFLRACHTRYETETHFFVHANYLPEVPLDEQDDHTLLWLSLREYVPGPHQSGKIAVLGHTPQAHGRILDWEHLKCIDTGCCYGGWLTALELNSGRQWQVNNWAEFRDPRSR